MAAGGGFITDYVPLMGDAAFAIARVYNGSWRVTNVTWYKNTKMESVFFVRKFKKGSRTIVVG
jgi:hypothetical protein